MCADFFLLVSDLLRPNFQFSETENRLHKSADFFLIFFALIFNFQTQKQIVQMLQPVDSEFFCPASLSLNF